MLTPEQKVKVTKLLNALYTSATSNVTAVQRKAIRAFIGTGDAGHFHMEGIPVSNFESAKVLRVVSTMENGNPLYPQELKSEDLSSVDIRDELNTMISIRTPSPEIGRFGFLTLQEESSDDDNDENDENDENDVNATHFKIS